MSLTHGGGKPNVSSIPYSPPQGPRKDDPMHVEPRHGMAGESLSDMPGEEFTGRPGIGGTNHGNNPSRNR